MTVTPGLAAYWTTWLLTQSCRPPAPAWHRGRRPSDPTAQPSRAPCPPPGAGAAGAAVGVAAGPAAPQPQQPRRQQRRRPRRPQQARACCSCWRFPPAEGATTTPRRSPRPSAPTRPSGRLSSARSASTVSPGKGTCTPKFQLDHQRWLAAESFARAAQDAWARPVPLRVRPAAGRRRFWWRSQCDRAHREVQQRRGRRRTGACLVQCHFFHPGFESLAQSNYKRLWLQEVLFDRGYERHP